MFRNHVKQSEERPVWGGGALVISVNNSTKHQNEVVTFRSKLQTHHVTTTFTRFQDTLELRRLKTTRGDEHTAVNKAQRTVVNF